MLTKEKCKNALDYLFDNSLLDDFASNNDMEKYNMLEQLINEHFDIPKSSPEVTISNWILCSERLPNHDESTDVLVTCVDRLTGKRSVVEDCYFYGVWCSMSDVIAWMPLPKPYEGGENVD